MDLLDDEEKNELQNDERDLFAALVSLGEETQEYDVEKDTLVSTFKRSENWKEALAAIRKLLKKYHTHRDLPMHTCMAKWRALQNKLLPMVARYSNDSDLLYNMGKVLVFLTHPLNPHPGGTRDLPMHAADQRDSLVTIARNRHFLPAFLNLVVPALDPSIKDSDKTERDLNSVDIVITVLDQLAAVPNGCAQDVAGTSELLVLELKKGGMIGLLTSLAALTERREFKRIVPVLMDLVFNMVRGQDGETLLRSHLATLASNAKKQQEQQLRGAGAGTAKSSSGEGSKKTSPTVVPKAYTPPGGAAGAASSSTAVNKGLPNASAAGGSHGKVGGASTTILLNVNGKRPYSSTSNNDDPLKALMKAERDTKAALMRSNGSDRHSRFGIQAYVRSIGTSQVGSAPPPQPQAKEGSAGAEGDGNNTAAASVAVNPLLLVPTSVYGPNGQLLNNQYKRVITGFKSDMAGNGIDFKTATASGAGMKQQRFHPNAANNRAAGMAARKGKHDLYRQELFVDTNSGVGAASTRSSTAMNMAANSTTGKLSASYLAASAAGGNMGGSGGGSIAAMAPQDLFADKETVGRARSALYELCLRLLSFGSPVAAGTTSNPTEDDEEDDGAAPPAFSTLAQRIKFLISRDSSDLVREDPLRYLHASAVVLAAHRASETHRVKSQTEEAHRLLTAAAQWKLQQAIKRKERMQQKQQQQKSASNQQHRDDVEEEAPVVVPKLNEEEKRQQEGEEALKSLEEAMGSGGNSEFSSSSAAAAAPAAASRKQAVNDDDAEEVEPELTPLERLYEHVLTHGILVPGISIEPVLELVDQWSWGRCQQMLSSYLDAKQWKAASVVLGHLKELLVFVNTINSGGNEGARRKGQGQVDIDITDASASSSSSSSSSAPLPLGHDVVYSVPKRVIRALDTAHLVKETDPTKFFLALSGNKNASSNNSPVSALNAANNSNARVVPVERSVLDLDEGEARPSEVLILPWSPLTASLFPSTSTVPLALSSPDCPQGLALAALRDVEARKPLSAAATVPAPSAAAGDNDQKEEQPARSSTPVNADGNSNALSLAAYITKQSKALLAATTNNTPNGGSSNGKNAGSLAYYSSLWCGNETATATADDVKYRPPYIPSASSYLAQPLLEDLMAVYREELLTLLPKALRLYEPGRYDLGTLAALVEASHHTLKLAEKAAIQGLNGDGSGGSGGKRKRKGAGAGGAKGKKMTRFDGDSSDDDDSDSDAKKKSKGKGKKKTTSDDDESDTENNKDTDQLAAQHRLHELERYCSEFAHPQVVKALCVVLLNYRVNSAKTNFQTVSLLRRLSALPNDYAGNDQNNQPFTYQVLLFSHSTLMVASTILNDRHACSLAMGQGSQADNYRCLLNWARDITFAFLRECRKNRLMWVEALFTRSEKSALADLARHYGLVDGAEGGALAYFNETEGKYVYSTADPSRVGADGRKKMSKAALARHEATLEAERNAYRDEDEEAAEAQLRLSDDDDDDFGSGSSKRKALLAKKKKAKKGKKGGFSSGDDEDSDSGSSTSSSDSDSDSGSSSGSPAKRRRLEAKSSSAAAANDSGSDSDSDDDSTATSSGSWKPAADAALRRLYPSYASLALAALGYHQKKLQQSKGGATAAPSVLLPALHSRVIAPLLQRDPVVSSSSSSTTATDGVVSRLQTLQLKINSPDDNDSTATASSSSSKQLPLFLRPLHYRLEEDAVALFLDLGRGQDGAAASSSAAAYSFNDDVNDEDGGYFGEGGSGNNGHEDTSGTAAIRWLSSLLRKAAASREQAEEKKRKEIRAAKKTSAGGASAIPPLSRAASTASTSNLVDDGSLSGTFSGFSQAGSTFKLAVQAFMLATTTGQEVVVPAGVPVQAMVAAAAELGISWQPPATGASSSSSSSSSSSDDDNETIGLLTLDSSETAAKTCVEDIPIYPITPAHFQWFCSTPSFTRLLQDVGIIRHSSTTNATSTTSNREAWWRIPGCLPSASLYAAADALDAALVATSTRSGSSSSSNGEDEEQQEEESIAMNGLSNEKAYNALISKGIVVAAPTGGAKKAMTGGAASGAAGARKKKPMSGAVAAKRKAAMLSKKKKATKNKGARKGSDSDDSSSSSDSDSSSSSDSDSSSSDSDNEKGSSAAPSSAAGAAAAAVATMPSAAALSTMDIVPESEGNENENDEVEMTNAAAAPTQASAAKSSSVMKKKKKLIRRGVGVATDSEDEKEEKEEAEEEAEAAAPAPSSRPSMGAGGGARKGMVIDDDDE